MDPTAPSITFFDKDTGKGRATYIGARDEDASRSAVALAPAS